MVPLRSASPAGSVGLVVAMDRVGVALKAGVARPVGVADLEGEGPAIPASVQEDAIIRIQAAVALVSRRIDVVIG
jgi:hypothetical protein